MPHAHAGVAPSVSLAGLHCGRHRHSVQVTTAQRFSHIELHHKIFRHQRRYGRPQRHFRPLRFTQDSASSSSPLRTQAESPEEGRNWFARCVGIIGSGALISKALGLVREQLVSTSLGLGGLADAFNLASVFPVLCLTGIGGLNGAIHSATASICGSGQVANPQGSSARCARAHKPLQGACSAWTRQHAA
jgi:hypothetical protein